MMHHQLAPLRHITAAVFAAVLLVMPLLLPKGFALTFLSQVAVISIFALSYNMLLGQTGLLSFGHAVYAGIGAYCAIHFLNRIGTDTLGLGLVGLPLVGAAGGAIAGLIFGYISTRRAGTAFAMITLGIAEMVVALAAMLPSLSGGEGGLTTNRMLSKPILGIDFGSPTQMYYVALFWTAAAALAMYGYTRTPFGRLANAVRDNAERAAFIGFDPQRIRLIVMVLAGAFAGVAGGVSVLNYELVTAENLGIGQSGMVLIAAYLGGIGCFLGPIVGAFIYVLFLTVVSTITKAWLLYFGVLFIAVVLFAPEGIVIFLRNLRHRSLPSPRRIAMLAALLAAGIVSIESLYKLQDDATAVFSIGGVFDATQAQLLTAAILAAFALLALYLKTRGTQHGIAAMPALENQGQQP